MFGFVLPYGAGTGAAEAAAQSLAARRALEAQRSAYAKSDEYRAWIAGILAQEWERCLKLAEAYQAKQTRGRDV